MRREFTLNRLKDLLWILCVVGLVLGFARLFSGLGATTFMSDALPWGIWKIVNMVAGAALSTGAFLLACVIYVFQIEKYRPLARVAVIIAFLGYGQALVALFFDLGLPWRFWHPFFFWNPPSFLFEVFWCVTTYFVVAGLETMPIIFERLPWPRFTHFLHQVMLPIIVIGITLSTMHHTSLGSLFLAAPTRLHPLWYSSWLPLEFLVSAMAGGIAVVIFITLAYSWLYGKPVNLTLLSGLAKGVVGILLLFLLLRLADFAVHRKWNYLFGAQASWESAVFWAELLVQVILPGAILAVPAARNRPRWLTLGALLTVAGLVLHRLNTGLLGFFRSAEAIYFPLWSELAVSVGLLAAAGLCFLFLAEHFYVFEPAPVCDSPANLSPHPDQAPAWTWREFRNTVLSFTTFRMIVILVLALPLTLYFFRDTALHPLEPENEPVLPPTALDSARTLLKVDGNRKNQFVTFPHVAHHELLSGENSCATCHHLSLPKDHSTACWRCHRDMFQAVSFYHQKYHHKVLRKKLEEKETGVSQESRLAAFCYPCHQQDKKPLSPHDFEAPSEQKVARSCYSCHEKDMPGMENYKDKPLNFKAPGYMTAMHRRCLACHREYAETTQNPDLGNCQTCHPLQPSGVSTK